MAAAARESNAQYHGTTTHTHTLPLTNNDDDVELMLL